MKIIEKAFNLKQRKIKQLRRAIQRLSGKPYVHYLHINKTGGTAIKHTLRDYTESSEKYLICLHPHEYRLPNVPEGEKVFFFLRDPVQRFVSGFYCRKRKGQPRYLTEWRPEEEEAFRIFSNADQLARALSSDDREMKAKAEKAMRNMLHISTVYNYWFGDLDYFKSRIKDILFIGFQESLEEDFEVLKDKIFLPKSLALPRGNIQSHQIPEQFDRTLSELATKNLKEWYRADYEFLNFCKQLRTKL